MPKVFGYARVSTTDQSTAIQEAALKAAGAHVVFSERVSGTTRDNRSELAKLLACLAPATPMRTIRGSGWVSRYCSRPVSDMASAALRCMLLPILFALANVIANRTPTMVALRSDHAPGPRT